VAHLRSATVTVAVDDVSFDVFEGEIFGSSGPTAPERPRPWNAWRAFAPTRGALRCWVRSRLGDAKAPQERIGVQPVGAAASVSGVWEAVDLWSSLYPRTVAVALLEQLDSWKSAMPRS
jgi:hypothetical protein